MAETAGAAATTAEARKAPAAGGTRRLPAAVAWLWLAPATALILGVVLVPVGMLVAASRGRYSITGLRTGDAGADNYRAVAGHPDLGTVLTNTLVWVIAVVALTLLVSLALAPLLAARFPGRRLVRWAVLVPWAASLVVTSQLFVLLYHPQYGLLNRLLQVLHVIDGPVDLLGDDRFVMPSMIAVGVFVSVPFTAFVLVAGLNAIPDELGEAARVDGASAWQRYRQITLPLLRPALMVAVVLNTIYVFNSFPVVYLLNDRNPGYAHDTTITFMYKLAFRSQEKDVGMAAAAGVLNFALILLAVGLYLRLVRGQQEDA